MNRDHGKDFERGRKGGAAAPVEIEEVEAEQLAGASMEDEQVQRGYVMDLPNGQRMSRKDYIRHLYVQGLPGEVEKGVRSDIVKYFHRQFGQDLTFQQVWQVTSDLGSEGRRGRRQVTVKLPNGEEKPRKEYIRELFENGSEEFGVPPGDRGAIVKHLNRDCDEDITYQVVWQATN